MSHRSCYWFPLLKPRTQGKIQSMVKLIKEEMWRSDSAMEKEDTPNCNRCKSKVLLGNQIEWNGQPSQEPEKLTAAGTAWPGIDQSRGWQTFSVMGKIRHILDFAEQMVSVAATQICPYNSYRKHENNCVCFYWTLYMDTEIWI